MGELERAAVAASRGAGLSLARLTFDCFANRRASMDAARITARLLRASDLACRDEDGTILIAFPETDLVTAHVVARRIASVLKHTTLAVGAERTRLGPTVALAAFRPRDTIDTLIARTVDQRDGLRPNRLSSSVSPLRLAGRPSSAASVSIACSISDR